MEYRLLGDTGVKVSALCLGTKTLGREADRTEDDSGALQSDLRFLPFPAHCDGPFGNG
jgi:aryl-alcohol dehydrogenase-like predicted oxidoreductase